MAAREGWQGRRRTGSKATEYHISSLPPVAQAALMARSALADAPADGLADARAVRPPAGLPAGQAMAQATGRQAAVAMARAGLARVVLGLESAGFSRTAACHTIAQMVAAGTAEPVVMQMAIAANDRPRAGAILSAASVMRFVADYLTAGESGLIPGRRQRDFAVPSWAAAFLKQYQQPMKPSVEDAYRNFQGAIKNPPSIHQVRRFLEKLSPEAREHGRHGQSELKTVQAYKGRSFAHLMPNDIWTADGHTFDAEIMHPHYQNKVFRPEITTFADIRTRRIVGFSVELAESSTAVLDGLRVSVQREGVPACLYVDNGTGYKNAVIEGVVARIGVTMTHAIAYNSQAKGVIERINQVWVRLAKRLPSYIGADMDKEAKTLVHKISRKALKAGLTHRALIGWDAFLELANAAVDEYNNRLHGALKQTPNEVLAEFVAKGWAPVGTDWAALDKLMMPMAERNTTRGLVQIHGRKYAHPDLVNHHGEAVLVAYDIRDAATVWIYDMNMRLICTAARDGHMTPYMPESRLADMRESRAQAQIKRLAAQIENKTGQKVAAIQLEHQPGRTLDGVFACEAIEREQADVALARSAVLAMSVPIDWATDAVGRWAQYNEWIKKEDLSEEQKRWVGHYPTTDEFARTAQFYADFERPVAAGR